MKVRTDFVTNSSSSSFTIQIELELTDGNVLQFKNQSNCGESFGPFSTVKAKLSPKIMGEASSLDELISLLQKGVIGTVYAAYDEDEDDEDWDEDDWEEGEEIEVEVFSKESESSSAKAFISNIEKLSSMDAIKRIRVFESEFMGGMKHLEEFTYDRNTHEYTGKESGFAFEEYPNGGCGGKLMIPDRRECKFLDSSLFGMTFAITGKVHIFKNREAFKEYVIAGGGHVTDSVNEKVDYLVNNDADSISAKNLKAKTLGVSVITEDEFADRFGSPEFSPNSKVNSNISDAQNPAEAFREDRISQLGQLQELQVGDTFFFGAYPQEKGKGIKRIEWEVIDKAGTAILVFSRYVLDHKPFHEAKVSTPWCDSLIREWLDTVFFSTAFIKEEQDLIMPTVINEPDREGNKRVSTDRVFLLSAKELKKYYPDKSDRLGPDHAWHWGLRSYSKGADSFQYCTDTGRINSNQFGDGSFTWKNYDCTLGVRPAMWISTAADIQMPIKAAGSEKDPGQKSDAANNLKGKKFVITGKVYQFKNREEFKAYVKENGGKVSDKINGDEEYLVNNDIESMSVKNRTAKKLGLPIITEQEFIELFGGPVEPQSIKEALSSKVNVSDFGKDNIGKIRSCCKYIEVFGDESVVIFAETTREAKDETIQFFFMKYFEEYGGLMFYVTQQGMFDIEKKDSLTKAEEKRLNSIAKQAYYEYDSYSGPIKVADDIREVYDELYKEIERIAEKNGVSLDFVGLPD